MSGKNSSKARAISKQKNAELHELKKSIAILKRMGVAFSRTSAKSLPSGTKHQKATVKKFADLLSGKSKAHKINKAGAEAFKAAGKRVVNNRLILDNLFETKTYVRGGRVFTSRRMENGPPLKSEILPIRTTRGEDFIEDLRKNAPVLPPGQMYAFSFHGGLSFQTFSTIDQLIDYVSRYDEFQEFDENEDDIVSHFHLMMFPEGANLQEGRPKRKRYRKSKPFYDQDYYQRTKARNPSQHTRKLEAANQRARAYYHAHKNDPGFKEARAAVERSRRAREKSI